MIRLCYRCGVRMQTTHSVCKACQSKESAERLENARLRGLMSGVPERALHPRKRGKR
jgi:uncharacterized OB-fold protein